MDKDKNSQEDNSQQNRSQQVSSQQSASQKTSSQKSKESQKSSHWDFASAHRSSKGIASAPSPKVQKDYSPTSAPTSATPAQPKQKKQPERQKTIKTNASLVDKLGALQMAMGYKNRTEAFEKVFARGAKELLAAKPGSKKRYKEAYNLIHN